jgi:ATP-dependent RNA helicase DDX49/DBP8
VLDEADRLLEPCFENDLSVILDSLPSKRQTLIFSATLTDCLLRLRNLATGGPFFWQDNSDVATVETLDQRYILMPAQVKADFKFFIARFLRDTAGNY